MADLAALRVLVKDGSFENASKREKKDAFNRLNERHQAAFNADFNFRDWNLFEKKASDDRTKRGGKRNRRHTIIRPISTATPKRGGSRNRTREREELRNKELAKASDTRDSLRNRESKNNRATKPVSAEKRMDNLFRVKSGDNNNSNNAPPTPRPPKLTSMRTEENGESGGSDDGASGEIEASKRFKQKHCKNKNIINKNRNRNKSHNTPITVKKYKKKLEKTKNKFFFTSSKEQNNHHLFTCKISPIPHVRESAISISLPSFLNAQSPTNSDVSQISDKIKTININTPEPTKKQKTTIPILKNKNQNGGSTVQPQYKRVGFAGGDDDESDDDSDDEFLHKFKQSVRSGYNNNNNISQ